MSQAWLAKAREGRQGQAQEPRACARTEQTSKPPQTGDLPLVEFARESLRANPSKPSKPLDVVVDRQSAQLEMLLSVIQQGARMGLARNLHGVNPTRVQWLMTQAADGEIAEDAYLEMCRRAGPVTTLGAVVETYRGCVAALEQSGEDAFTWRGALELALAHQPAAAQGVGR